MGRAAPTTPDKRHRPAAFRRLSFLARDDYCLHEVSPEFNVMPARLTESIDFHGSALMLRAERQKVLAGNIANADTPGFSARDFDFKAALADATGSQSGPAMARPSASAFVVSTTHSGHVAASGKGDTGSSRIDSTAMKYRNAEQPSLDGNTVDLDRERANFADNALRYEAALRFINGSVRNMLSAIRGD
jgi:flagellar basal-body rod protein FlgB